MPIYEYRCSSCGAEHEALQKLSDPLLTTCPACHRETLVKKVSAAGFQLKGSGWYVTDFRNGGKPAAKPAAKPEAKKDTVADGAKADGGEAKKDAPAAASTASESSTTPATPAPAKPASTE